MCAVILEIKAAIYKSHDQKRLVCYCNRLNQCYYRDYNSHFLALCASHVNKFVFENCFEERSIRPQLTITNHKLGEKK